MPVDGASLTGFNNLDQIVGYFYDTQSHSFVYDHGALHTFELPGATVTSAPGINDFGEVTGGWEEFGDGSSDHGFVATPIPEPVTLSLVATGFGVLAGAIRKRVA